MQLTKERTLNKDKWKAELKYLYFWVIYFGINRRKFVKEMCAFCHHLSAGFQYFAGGWGTLNWHLLLLWHVIGPISTASWGLNSRVHLTLIWGLGIHALRLWLSFLEVLLFGCLQFYNKSWHTYQSPISHTSHTARFASNLTSKLPDCLHFIITRKLIC